MEKTFGWDIKIKGLRDRDSDDIFDSHKAIVRSDNNKLLSIMKNSYCPFENSKMEDILGSLSDKFSMPLYRLGEFKGGRRLFGQLEVGESSISGSNLKRYITVLNSHDGSSSLAFGSSNTYVRCSNQFQRIQKELSKIKHTTSMPVLLEKAFFNFEKVLGKEEEIVSNFRDFAEEGVSRKFLLDMTGHVFNIKLEQEDGFSDVSRKYSTNMANKVNKLVECINLEVNDLGMTKWSIFNGVTRYTTHELKNPFIDSGLSISNKAYEFATL